MSRRQDDDAIPYKADIPEQGTIRSRRQAAAFFGVSERTFDRLQKDAAIPFVIVGKRKKYLLRDLEIYLMSQRSV